ncbi:hypothetical protein BGX34_008360 [Mortierella sp. NVP85]|nr:hypothetical protein BGX34_008360 [Mortierella sp. NVP85]
MAAEIPELSQHIVQYLDFDTLKTFALVCKTWYLAARPSLWKHFTYEVPLACWSQEEHANWLSTIRRNAGSFRHIYRNSSKPIPGYVSDLLLDQCRSLVTIEAFVFVTDVRNPCRYWEETFKPLIEQNKASLRRLELQLIDIPCMDTLQLPSLVVGLQYLRTLELGAPDITVEDLLPILDACPSSLECLDIHSRLRRRRDLVIEPHHSPTTATAISYRFKHLCIYGICDNEALGAVLSRLAVHTLEGLLLGAAIPLLEAPTLQNALWRLTHLRLDWMYDSSESVLSTFLNAIHPHQLRHVHLSNMTILCTEMLMEQQHQSLESLTVNFEMDHSGALGNILATCSKLKRLVFSVMPSADIQVFIDPLRPWVCTELEVFEGSFGQRPLNANADTERLRQIEISFMQRLGQLTKLHSLMQKYCELPIRLDRDVDPEVMGWSLSSGLEHLHGLNNLETFKFDWNFPKRIGILEMIFIKEHWCSLKEVRCKKIDNEDVLDWLATEWPELKVIVCQA